MRFVTALSDGRPQVAVRVDGGLAPTGYDNLIALIRDGDDGLAAARAAIRSGRRMTAEDIRAPLTPGKMLFCGVNYPDHAEENPDAVMPTEPFFFSKLPNAVVGPGAEIRKPSPVTHLDYEVELAVIVGRTATRVTAASALSYVFGYTVVNDISAREVQFKDNQITLGKNADTFCPIGPEVLTSDELGDPSNVRVATYVNGKCRQSSTTSAWLFDVPSLLEFLTRTVTLEPGDLVTTGTPSGVAAFRHPPLWLMPGDEVTVEVDAIGCLTNPVVAGWSH